MKNNDPTNKVSHALQIFFAEYNTSYSYYFHYPQVDHVIRNNYNFRDVILYALGGTLSRMCIYIYTHIDEYIIDSC